MAAREAYLLYVERAVEGAVPPQMSPYHRSSQRNPPVMSIVSPVM
jgi:hypothetical protein